VEIRGLRIFLQEETEGTEGLNHRHSNPSISLIYECALGQNGELPTHFLDFLFSRTGFFLQPGDANVLVGLRMLGQREAVDDPGVGFLIRSADEDVGVPRGIVPFGEFS